MLNEILTTIMQSDELRLFGIKVINSDDFITMILRFFINLVMLVTIVRYLYYPQTLRKDYLFTFLLIGLLIFFMCFLLASVKLQLGFALGLFAVFGIIRYRTNPIPIKEMTYLFLVITISVINAISSKKVSYAELLFANAAILISTFILEKLMMLRHLSHRVVIYERIDLIKPSKRAELLADLKDRTGLEIKRIEIGKIDFLKDVAWITIHFINDTSKGIPSLTESGNKFDDDED